MNDFSIGVDLGGTNLRIAAVDVNGHLVEKVTLGTKVSLGTPRKCRHSFRASTARRLPSIRKSIAEARWAGSPSLNE